MGVEWARYEYGDATVAYTDSAGNRLAGEPDGDEISVLGAALFVNLYHSSNEMACFPAQAAAAAAADWRYLVCRGRANPFDYRPPPAATGGV